MGRSVIWLQITLPMSLSQTVPQIQHELFCLTIWYTQATKFTSVEATNTLCGSPHMQATKINKALKKNTKAILASVVWAFTVISFKPKLANLQTYISQLPINCSSAVFDKLIARTLTLVHLYQYFQCFYLLLTDSVISNIFLIQYLSANFQLASLQLIRMLYMLLWTNWSIMECAGS